MILAVDLVICMTLITSTYREKPKAAARDSDDMEGVETDSYLTLCYLLFSCFISYSYRSPLIPFLLSYSHCPSFSCVQDVNAHPCRDLSSKKAEPSQEEPKEEEPIEEEHPPEFQDENLWTPDNGIISLSCRLVVHITSFTQLVA